MKKLLFLAMVLLIIGFFSCKKDGSIANSTATISPKAVLMGSYITEQTPDIRTVPLVWEIRSFIFNKEDMTSQFAEYNFVFNDPIVIASTKMNTYYGKWNLISTKQLSFDFPAPPSISNGNFDIKAPDRFILSILNEEWIIKEISLHSLLLEIRNENYSKEVWFYTKI